MIVTQIIRQGATWDDLEKSLHLNKNILKKILSEYYKDRSSFSTIDEKAMENAKKQKISSINYEEER